MLERQEIFVNSKRSLIRGNFIDLEYILRFIYDNFRDENQDSCCCKNESWKKKSQDYEDKMGRYYYETSFDEEDQMQKPSKHIKTEIKFKASKSSDPDKHVPKKASKKVKDIDDDATSVYAAEPEKNSGPKIKDSHSADPKNVRKSLIPIIFDYLSSFNFPTVDDLINNNMLAKVCGNFVKMEILVEHVKNLIWNFASTN